MAVELSSNWKKLQARIKTESTAKNKTVDRATTGKDKTATPAQKRARGSSDESHHAGRLHSKRARSGKPGSTAPTERPGMGVTQSSQLSGEAAYTNNGKGLMLAKGITPSLALWAADHDISAEDLAQAYGLAGTGTGQAGGGGPARSRRGAAPLGAVPGMEAQTLLEAAAADDRENAGLTAGLVLGKYVALDCEMVGVGAEGRDDALARVSMVDFFGRQVYDSYVRMQPGVRVVDWRTRVSGITPHHLRARPEGEGEDGTNGARPFREVQTAVAGLLDGTLAATGKPEGPRILVGHDVRHDLRVLELQHPPRLVRDTAKFSGFKQYGHGPKPSLRVLAQELLGVVIQRGAHSSVQDARVTMQLFRQHKPAFDVECANKFCEVSSKGGGRKKTKKKH